jgi:hypothetical protein
MDVDEIRDRIAEVMQHPDHRVVPLGNRVHVYSGEDEFEIVIRTMQPKGSSRLDPYRVSP